ncbi:MAG: SIR2 family NAD-dependent protein deacylase [Armatimonadota bacterium]
MTQDKISRLADMMCDATVYALTGAGISTESGIPDFRSPGGLWEQVDPMEYLSREALQERPRKFWGFLRETVRPISDAEPNDGHRALAEMEKLGHIKGVITQNIDNLHQQAGSRNVLEVHGHLRTTHCTRCDAIMPLEEAFGKLHGQNLPTCEECGGDLRPDVVLFGDQMAPDFQSAIDAVMQSDMVISVGSSLSVSPANMLAVNAPRLAIINRTATACDSVADMVLRSSAGAMLQAVLQELRNR